MNRRPPRVTIGMPTYNAEKYVAAAIGSLLDQTFEDFELIISDNASTDSTSDICREFARTDARVRYVRSEVNHGAAWNFNEVCRRAGGELFKLAACDDLCAPTLLERCVAAFDSAPESVVSIYPRTILIDADGHVLEHYDDRLDNRYPHPHQRLLSYLRHQNLCNALFGVHRLAVYRSTRQMQPFDSADVVLLAELVLRGQMWELPEALFYRRMHAEMASRAHADPVASTRWYDPSQEATRVYRRSRLTKEVVRAIGRAPLSPMEKVRCTNALIGTWGPRYGRVIGGELKQALRHSLRLAS